MKTEQGLVLEVHGDIARIRVGRHNDCSACGACASAQNMVLEALNPLQAKPGQRVRFEMKEANVLQGAFMVFVMPLLCAALGGLFGWQAGMTWQWDATKAAVFGAVVFFLFSLLGVKLFDRSVAKKQSLKPVIVEILS